MLFFKLEALSIHLSIKILISLSSICGFSNYEAVPTLTKSVFSLVKLRTTDERLAFQVNSSKSYVNIKS